LQQAAILKRVGYQSSFFAAEICRVDTFLTRRHATKSFTLRKQPEGRQDHFCRAGPETLIEKIGSVPLVLTQNPIPRQNLIQMLTSGGPASQPFRSFAANPARRQLSRLTAIAFFAGCLTASSIPVWAQGGGNANAIGIGIQNSANAAAAAQNSAAMGDSGGSSGQPSAPPGMGTGAPTGLETYGDSGGGASYSADMYGAEMAGAEMAGGEMYSGSDPGGYGGPGGRPSQPGMQGLMMSAGGSYLSSIAEFLNRPLSPGAVKFQPTLAEEAALAFHYGDQRKALALFHAHVIAERESASEGLEAIRYNPLARRPAWAIRIGVSLHPRVPDALADDPQPIREGDVATTPANNRGGAPGRGRGRGGQMAGGSAGMEMNEPGMAGMAGASGVGMAGMGALGMPGGGMAGMEGEGMMGADGMMMGSEGMMGAAGGQPAKAAPMVNPAIAAAAAADKALESHLGMITDLVKSQVTSRFNAGKFGTVLPRLAAKGTALAENAAKNGMALPAPANGPILMWVPGVDFVGTGDVNSMIEKCRENDVDILLHFDVIVKETRAEPQYDARCRLINCASGENISVSKAINKRDVLLAARKRSNAAVIAELMQPVFDGLDTKVIAMPMPPLQPQHAVSRVDTLLAKPDVARPDNLAEVAMFHHKRLIDDDQFEQVMFFAAGENGLRLLYASPDDRAELGKSLVERQLQGN